MPSRGILPGNGTETDDTRLPSERYRISGFPFRDPGDQVDPVLYNYLAEMKEGTAGQAEESKLRGRPGISSVQRREALTPGNLAPGSSRLHDNPWPSRANAIFRDEEVRVPPNGTPGPGMSILMSAGSGLPCMGHMGWFTGVVVPVSGGGE